MLSHKILTRQDSGRAARYYEDGVDDYFSKEGDASQWMGTGAKHLGLSGPVDSEKFQELLAGQIDDQTWINRAVIRPGSRARIGIDLTFSAPKSVSLQALIAGDMDLIKTHDKAVARALALVEQKAQTRQKVNGVSHVQNTGNLVIAVFRHETSREQDPQLHTHAILMNMTQRKDGQWRALKNDQIIKMTRYLGAVYRAELAHEVQQLGYALRLEPDGLFELSHISRGQIEAFSKRGQQVEQFLDAQGLDRNTASTQQKQRAALQSRTGKSRTDREALYSSWVSLADMLDIDFKKDGAFQDVPLSLSVAEAAKRAVRYAINHLTERQSIMTEQELIDCALKQGTGLIRIEDIQQEITRQNKLGFLIREETRYTTQTAREREKRILSIEQQGRNIVCPLMTESTVASSLRHSSLNDSQKQAVDLIMTSRNRVIGIQGLAGTGKSHMLSEATRLMTSRKIKVQALACYGAPVKALQSLSIPAQTVASFLKSKDRDLNEHSVIFLDEAGVTPTRQMEQLLKIVEQAGARIILIGDTRQTQAIEAGRPFDQLIAAGMQTANMTTILRQKDPVLKKAVELAARGDSASSLTHLKNILEIKDPTARHQHIADDYGLLDPEDRKQTLILSGTNEARRDINMRVRSRLGLSGKGVMATLLMRRDTTQAQRRYARTYHIGDIIQPEKDYPKSGLKHGCLYSIIDKGPGNWLLVQAENGNQFRFSPSSHRKLSVYRPERIELSPGDQVRITRNNAKLDIANGDRFEVEGITRDTVSLNDGKRTLSLPTSQPLYLDYAYAATVHSAQGLTADRVLIDADSKSLTTSKQVYYVAISRARHEAKLYTDDRSALPSAITRAHEKSAALDLEKSRNKQPMESSHSYGADHL